MGNCHSRLIVLYSTCRHFIFATLVNNILRAQGRSVVVLYLVTESNGPTSFLCLLVLVQLYNYSPGNEVDCVWVHVCERCYG